MQLVLVEATAGRQPHEEEHQGQDRQRGGPVTPGASAHAGIIYGGGLANRGRSAPAGRSHGGSDLNGYRRALRSPAFRRLWVAAAISRAGDAINFVALPVFAYAATDSAGAVAVLVGTEGVALIAGGAAAHLVIDRLPPRALLAGIDLGRAAAALALAAAPGYPAAVAVAALLALGTSWFSPTSAALVPRLVDPASRAAANALLWTAGVALQLVAAPLGGLLITVAPARVAFGLNALSFAVSALILTRLPHNQAAAAAGTGAWRQLPEVIRAIPLIPLLGPLLVTQALAALAVGATSALLVVLAQNAYGLTGAGYGLWLAVIGGGALLGPLLAVRSSLSAATVVAGAYTVRGAGDLVLGALSNGFAGGALLFMYGLGTSSGTVAYQTLVQAAVPEALRGRVFALLDVVWQSARLASIVLGGLMAEKVGVRWVFGAGGSLLLLAAVSGWMGLSGAMVAPTPEKPGSA
ncbi:MAG: MFS transporter [Candidatus Dormibacteria bacterium]